MKLITCVAIAIMLFAVSVQAAEVPTSAGDKAMVFMFHGLDDLAVSGYGHDYGFGMRYYLSDGMALRGGVLFGMSTYTDESVDPESEISMTSFGVEAVYEMHMEGPCASVSPYFGVGGNFDSYTEEWDNYEGYETAEISETGFGIFGTGGFEWGFTDCMTLGGEYRLGFMSMSTETTIEGDVCCEESGTWMGFGTASAYLSVYW